MGTLQFSIHAIQVLVSTRLLRRCWFIEIVQQLVQLIASGTINASGADYAEYMTKSGNFTLAKGDVCGVNSEGKLTNVFADAISFVVKSTDPSYVGGDKWPKLLVSNLVVMMILEQRGRDCSSSKLFYEEALESASTC